MKKFLMLSALLLMVSVSNAQEVLFENETISFERTIEASGLNAAQIMAALQTMNPPTPKEGTDWVDTSNEEAKYVVLARETEWYQTPVVGFVSVIMRFKCYAKDGKVKVVANTFHEKMKIGGRGATVTPVVKETTPLSSITEEQRASLSEHVKQFAMRIEEKIRDAEKNWKF